MDGVITIDTPQGLLIFIQLLTDLDKHKGRIGKVESYDKIRAADGERARLELLIVTARLHPNIQRVECYNTPGISGHK